MENTQPISAPLQIQLVCGPVGSAFLGDRYFGIVHLGRNWALHADPWVSPRLKSIFRYQRFLGTPFVCQRSFVAYFLSLLFTLIYGSVAAHNQRAEKIMIPILDIFRNSGVGVYAGVRPGNGRVISPF